MDYLPHDYDVDQANQDALETWDRATIAGPPTFSFDCDHCGDGDALRDGEDCAYCGRTRAEP